MKGCTDTFKGDLQYIRSYVLLYFLKPVSENRLLRISLKILNFKDPLNIGSYIHLFYIRITQNFLNACATRNKHLER